MIDLTMFRADGRDHYGEPECSPYLRRPVRPLHRALRDVADRRGLSMTEAVRLVSPENVVRMEDYRK